MKNNVDNKLVPKLRFLEFENEWESSVFDKLFNIGSGKDYKHLLKGNVPVYGSGGYMLSVNKFLYEGESVCIGRKGTIDKPIFLTGKFWTVDTLFYTHSFKDCFPKFIFLLFQNINWKNFNEAGGIPSLSKKIIREIEVLIPEFKEQQKIADCLSSLDELITANNEKLAVLKAHKKGLLQQLFPAEGKKVPKFRFPEFINDGNWNLEPFHKVYDLKSSNSFSRDKLNYKKGEVKNIHYGDIHTKFSTLFDITKEDVPFINENISIEKIDVENYCIEGDIVFADASEDIDDIGKSIEIVNLDNQKLLCGLHTFLARPINKKMVLGFGGFLFKSNKIRLQIKREAQGAKVLGISKGRLSNVEISLPSNPKEQKKIADCLTSIDNKIEAQTKKIEVLKWHKKGLMQQLFPTINEEA